MLCKPVNPNLYQQLKFAWAVAFKSKDTEDQEHFTSFDTDNVKYDIEAVYDKITFSFFCEDFQNLWKHIGDHTIKTHYPQFKVQVPGANGFPISVIIDQDTLTKITVSAEKLFENVAERFASFKRNIFAAPYEMVMIAIKNGGSVPPVSFSLRSGEKTWIIQNKSQFTVYMGISFKDLSEQQIVKILLTEAINRIIWIFFFCLQEFTEAKKHINNSPAIALSESELPAYLIEAFPQEKTAKYDFTNGIISFNSSQMTAFFSNTINDVKNQAGMMAGFRHYLHYHCQASKCNLHSRVIRRIDKFYESLNLSRYEKVDVEYTQPVS